MSAEQQSGGEHQSDRPALRIGDVARAAGTTPRTIRYYEEIGLLPGGPRNSGQHRLYTEPEVERLREVMRLKELLGVSLDELKTLLEVEEARAAVRAQLRHEDLDPARRLELLRQALGHLDRQLELVDRRSSDLARLRADLRERRERVHGHIRSLQETPAKDPARDREPAPAKDPARDQEPAPAKDPARDQEPARAESRPALT